MRLSIVKHKAVFVDPEHHCLLLLGIKLRDYPPSYSKWKFEAEVELLSPPLLKEYKNECFIKTFRLNSKIIHSAS